MTKMTYVTALNTALTFLTDNGYDNAEVIEKLTALRDAQVKRNSADRKPTKAQVANEGLKAKVLAVLTSDPCTVSDLMTRDAELGALSNQKVSALVNALVRDGAVLKVPDGRKSTFCLAE